MTKTEFKNKYREWYHDYAEKIQTKKLIYEEAMDFVQRKFKTQSIALSDLIDLISDFLYTKED